eukprot:3234859-Alexandrium_andersonii.AAC.1
MNELHPAQPCPSRGLGETSTKNLLRRPNSVHAAGQPWAGSSCKTPARPRCRWTDAVHKAA